MDKLEYEYEFELEHHVWRDAWMDGYKSDPVYSNPHKRPSASHPASPLKARPMSDNTTSMNQEAATIRKIRSKAEGG